MPYEARRGEFLISTDPALIDLDMVHGFLSRSYWATGIPREIVARSIQFSLPFGIYRVKEKSDRPEQIGIARVITDRATFAYLSDVFIAEAFRGRGLGKWLMEVIFAHPDLQNLRRFCLLTADAQDLYARFGFQYLADPRRYMERIHPDVYKRGEAGT